MPAIARVISDPEERQPLIEAEAQRWGRADVENMLQHTPLIVLSVDGDPPNRPPATRSDHIALPEEVSVPAKSQPTPATATPIAPRRVNLADAGRWRPCRINLMRSRIGQRCPGNHTHFRVL